MTADCLVVGGSGGIGSAIVTRLARRGKDVVFTYLKAAQSAQLLEKDCAELPGQVSRAQLDVRDTGRVEELVSGCGPVLSTVIFCAASGVSRSVRDTTDRHFDFTVNTNVRGFMATYQASFPALARNRGALIAFSSLGSQKVMPGYGVIGASKAALECLARYMAIEGASEGIRVNVISAGPVDTKALRSKVPGGDEVIARLTRTPLGRSLQPDDIAAAVDWLAGDAATMVTGQVISLDGGSGLRGHLDLLTAGPVT
jgi:enoyl-[acyl-carrier protein] reductase III